MKKRQPCIYKITNLVDGKVYIGQTNVSFEARKYAHTYELKRGIHKNKYLQNAVKKHGIENFVIEKIQECETDDLDKLETTWINFFDSTDRKYGYNLEGGGNTNKTTHEETKKILSLKGKKFWKTPKGRALIKKRTEIISGHNNYNARKVICINDQRVFDCIQYASEYYGISNSEISCVCRSAERLSTNGLQFAYYQRGKEYKLEDILPKTGGNNPNAVKVICINDGKVFDTLIECANFYGLSSTNVSQVCKGKRITTGGLQFSYYEESKSYELKDIPNRKGGEHHAARKVICINDNKIFDSIIEASEYYGINYQNLHQVVLEKNKSTQSEDGKWLQFAYYEEGKIYELKAVDESRIKTPKKVMCINTGQVFESIGEAARVLGLLQSKISLVCNGKRKHTGGLNFKFIQ